MRSSPKGFWHALEAVPGLSAVSAEWRIRFGDEYESAKTFLRPNGKRAASHPCTVPGGCGCAHEVVEHGPDDIVAVCRCGRGCGTFPLKASYITVYELDRTAFCQAVARAFKLRGEPESAPGLHHTARIGVYSPYAGFRFPVYLTIQLEPGDFEYVVSGLVSQTDKPFVLLAPTRDLCTARTEQVLANRKSAFIPLAEDLDLAGRRKLRLCRPLADILASFPAAHLPAPKDNGSMIFFPTPPDATWRNVSIRFTDSHTVSVRVKSVSRKCHYAQMGMANKKSSHPTVQWELLYSFAKERGVLDWSSRYAHRQNQKRREILARNLQSFFRIEGDPFRLTGDGKGWRARFRISPDD